MQYKYNINAFLMQLYYIRNALEQDEKCRKINSFVGKSEIRNCGKPKKYLTSYPLTYIIKSR